MVREHEVMRRSKCAPRLSGFFPVATYVDFSCRSRFEPPERPKQLSRKVAPSGVGVDGKHDLAVCVSSVSAHPI